MGDRQVAAHKIRDDADAQRVLIELANVAYRVVTDQPAAVTPPWEGMIRLGSMDRASYVWFLPCDPDGPGSPAGVSGGKRCNHGFGVDREHLGQWTIRAWAHGGAGVFDVRLTTREVTREQIATAATLVGIRLRAPLDGDPGMYAKGIPNPHPPENCGPLKGIPLGSGDSCPTCGLVPVSTVSACKACASVGLPACGPDGCLYPPRGKDEVET